MYLYYTSMYLVPFGSWVNKKLDCTSDDNQQLSTSLKQFVKIMGFSRHSLSRWRATQLSLSNKTVAFVNVIKVDISDSQYDPVRHAPLNQFFFLRPDTRAFLARSSSPCCGRVHDSYPPLSLSNISNSFRPKVSLQQVQTCEKSRRTSTVRDVGCTLSARQRLSWLARHLSTICATANPTGLMCCLLQSNKWGGSCLQPYMEIADPEMYKACPFCDTLFSLHLKLMCG